MDVGGLLDQLEMATQWGLKPEHREVCIAIIREWLVSERAKGSRTRRLERERQRMRQKRADPAFREHERLRKRDPETRKREDERKRQRYATDPAYRERRLELNRKRLADPAFRARKRQRERERLAEARAARHDKERPCP